MRFPAGEPPIHTEVGQRRGGLIEFLGAEGTGAYGPYIPLRRGRYVARLRFRAGWASGGAAVLDVSADVGETRIASLPFEAARLAETGMAVELPFEAEADLAGVEIRLFCRPGFTGALEAVEIDPAPEDLSDNACWSRALARHGCSGDGGPSVQGTPDRDRRDIKPWHVASTLDS